MNTFPMAQISDRAIPTKAFQDNANLFFSGELPAGKAFNILDEVPSFFASGFCLPEVIGHLFHHGLLLLQSLIYCFAKLRSKPLSVG
jgi:hypothetical protein